jgi:hypothetical protein
MMEAACTSETSVDNYFTWQCIPGDKSELHTRRRENLKSQIYKLILKICCNCYKFIFMLTFSFRMKGEILLKSNTELL